LCRVTPMSSPKITVVVPLYNKEEYVARALGSVLNQPFFDFELVVVDDGSTDAGATVVKRFSDPRIRLITQQNQGVSAARNRGVAEARAEYVAFLDADDAYLPKSLNTFWTLRQSFPNGRFFASAFEVISPDGGKRVRKLGFDDDRHVNLMDYLECCVHTGSPIHPSAMMVHKPLLEKVGLFPVGQKRGEDLDTWVRLLMETPLVYCGTPLTSCWDALPASACVSYQDVYVRGNPTLELLEKMAAGEWISNSDKERVFDYLAWYMAGPVDRLIARGDGREARMFIVSAMRSRRFRGRYLIKYLKSWYAPLGAHWRRVGTGGSTN